MKKDLFENFPTLQESNIAIKNLKNHKWPEYNQSDNKNIDEFKKRVFSKIDNEFKFHTHVLQPLKCSDFNLSLFRVRDLSSFTNVDIFSEHSFPPSHMTKMGRCNFPKTPVFYCSNDPGTSLFEVIRENDFKNMKFCVSRWKVKATDEILFFENFLRKELPKENSFKALNETLIDKLDKTFEKKLSLDKRKGLKKYFEFLDNSFITDDSYSVSASIAHNSLYREHDTRTDILMYPSKQSNLRGVNLAINPNFVCNNMYVDRFYVVEINKIFQNKRKYNISFINYGSVVNRLIHWKIITEKDEQFEEFVKSDFGMSFYKNIEPKSNSAEK